MHGMGGGGGGVPEEEELPEVQLLLEDVACEQEQTCHINTTLSTQHSSLSTQHSALDHRTGCCITMHTTETQT